MSLAVLQVKPPPGKPHPLDLTLNPILPRHAFVMLVISPPRSGKSSLVANILVNPQFYNALEYWETVYFFSPSQKFDKTTNMYLPKLENVISIDDHEELSRLDILLKGIMDEQIKISEEDDPITGKKKAMPRILLVFDDCLGYLTTNQALANMITRHRHFSASVIICAQSFRRIPLVIRNCAGNIIFHRLNNKSELQKIDDEYGSNYTDDFQKIATAVTSKKYDFIYMENEELKMYHNIDKLIIDSAL